MSEAKDLDRLVVPGLLFEHRRVLDAASAARGDSPIQPAVYRVTRCAQGIVYFRQVGASKTTECAGRLLFLERVLGRILEQPLWRTPASPT